MARDEGSRSPPLAEPDNAESKELASLKRAREGSVEPSLPGSNPPTTSITTTKKNRLEPTVEANDTSPVKSTSGGALPEANGTSGQEAKNVKEVRRKVEKMNWKEGEGGPSDLTENDNKDSEWEEIGKEEADEAKARASATETETETAVETSSTNNGDGLKRKALDRSESSTAVSGEEKSKRPKDTPSPPTAEKKLEPESVAPAPAKKPQTTFSAFSSSASPFATARTASPLASASSAAIGTPAKSAFSGSAFGNYSSTASPFAKKPPPPKDGDVKETEEEADGDKAGPSSFGDILKESKADVKDDEEKLRMSEQDVHTGEEEEETVYQTRSKLYVMQGDGGWRERGVGTLKLNVRASDGKGARLVMRAEGVLRLILNVSLYVGMSCLEDGKHVRMTVFEGKERRLITFRTGSTKAAVELCGFIHDHIPLESTPAPASKSPEPA